MKYILTFSFVLNYVFSTQDIFQKDENSSKRKEIKSQTSPLSGRSGVASDNSTDSSTRNTPTKSSRDSSKLANLGRMSNRLKKVSHELKALLPDAPPLPQVK